MNSRPDPLSLDDWQARFAAALLAPDHDAAQCVEFAHRIRADGIPALARLRVYRNNSRLVQTEALGRTYAVLRRRVGDDFFGQLAADYRLAKPSPRGDLHWIGAAFPDWLSQRLTGTGYEWLTDLARLEWACEQALVAPVTAALPLSALAEIAPEALAGLTLSLAPCIHLVRSPWPIWTVWRENQPDAPGNAVDLNRGGECVLVARSDGQLVLHALPEHEWSFVAELAAGASLEAALDRSSLPIESLAPVLQRLFAGGFVSRIEPPPTEGTP